MIDGAFVPVENPSRYGMTSQNSVKFWPMGLIFGAGRRIPKATLDVLLVGVISSLKIP